MLYAKRHFEGKTLVEETLEEHIKYCLNVYDNIIKVIPKYPVDIENTLISWEEICFLLVVFHDMGKAALGFQTITLNLNSSDSWRFRHEVLSAEFIDLVELDENIKESIKIAVLGHHEKSIKELRKLSFSDDYTDLFGSFSNIIEGMVQARKNIYKDARESLYANWNESLVILKWIQHEYENRFYKRLKLSFDFDDLGNACNTIDNYYYEIENQGSKYNFELILVLKGILITCDHLGSGHENIYSIDKDILQYFSKKFKVGIEKNDFRSTQKQSNTDQNSLLIAPTGTGKTEAALIWANNHLRNNNYTRVFYVLPYVASINAMYDRLKGEDFAANKVDMKHGRTLYSYYRNLIEHGKDEEANEDVKEMQNKARLMRQTSKEISKPIKIVTPHQIIKAFHKVKGYETLITEFYNAAFILDEIHCYDEELACMLVLCLQYLERNLNAKLFLMSATIPNILKEIILRELDIKNEPITMSDSELQMFVKHRLYLLRGNIENNIEAIQEDLINGKRVLVVCNTVKKAQYMYDKLKQFSDIHILLHSYYTVNDRNKIENALLKGEKGRHGYKPVQLLVGTQAIEVSLDLDFDTIYTEIAPIDALIQRFGRVYRNRIRLQGDYGDVKVCCEHDRGSDYIYNRKIKLIDKTLANLLAYDGQLLTNDVIQSILNAVYDDDYKNLMIKTLEEQRNKFEYLTFYPLKEYSEEAEEYYSQFDGIKLCPEVYFDKYKELISEGMYVEAEGYAMTVPERKIVYYLMENKIKKEQINKKKVIFVAYDVHFNYNSEIGLQENGINPDEGVFID